jgi:hypothetical protein
VKWDDGLRRKTVKIDAAIRRFQTVSGPIRSRSEDRNDRPGDMAKLVREKLSGEDPSKIGTAFVRN